MSVYHVPLSWQVSLMVTTNVQELHWQLFQFNCSLLPLMSTNLNIFSDNMKLKTSIRFFTCLVHWSVLCWLYCAFYKPFHGVYIFIFFRDQLSREAFLSASQKLRYSHIVLDLYLCAKVDAICTSRRKRNFNLGDQTSVNYSFKFFLTAYNFFTQIP